LEDGCGLRLVDAAHLYCDAAMLLRFDSWDNLWLQDQHLSLVRPRNMAAHHRRRDYGSGIQRFVGTLRQATAGTIVVQRLEEHTRLCPEASQLKQTIPRICYRRQIFQSVGVWEALRSPKA
jgi:hypothetical protein